MSKRQYPCSVVIVEMLDEYRCKYNDEAFILQIDTHDRVTMEKSICKFLHLEQVDLNHLYTDIDNSPDESRFFISEYIDDHWNGETFDKVQFYHLSRRLIGSDIEDCLNLKDLLTTDNVFSVFLKKHYIIFRENEKEMIDLYYHNNKVPLSCFDEIPTPNLVSRLQKDFCVNGFAIRDSLEKEDNGYFQSLRGCPEFIRILDDVLHLDGMLYYSYLKESKPYCIEYNVPIKEIIIDGKSQEDPQEVKTIDLLNGFINHLYDQRIYPSESAECVVLRLRDNVEMNSEYFVRAEEI